MTDPAIFVPDLIRWEGAVPFMYRDTEGYVTVGIGNLVHDADQACTLPFMTAGYPSSHAEIQRDFLRVISLARGMAARAYRAPSEPRVELTDVGVSDLAVSRLRREFLPGLARICKGFDGFPGPAQAALVDMAWNVGMRGLETFGHMLAAVDRRDWKGAAESCHRLTSRPERNAWTADMFRAA